MQIVDTKVCPIRSRLGGKVDFSPGSVAGYKLKIVAAKNIRDKSSPTSWLATPRTEGDCGSASAITVIDEYMNCILLVAFV